MEDVSKVVMKPLEKSIYMKPYTMHFVQNGTKRTWDLLTVPDSVVIIIYNITRDVLVLVKQFRPAVYIGAIPEEDRKFDQEIDIKKYRPEIGVTIELCGGKQDKNKSEAEIAKEEILEECGYDVPISRLQRVSSYRSGVGSSASVQTAFYCEVTDDMKVSSGGGVDGEIIDVVEMNVEEIKKYISQNYIKSPPIFMFGIYWFLYNKVK